MVKKLQNLTQGSYTVSEYYDILETTLLYSFIEESEKDFIYGFWRGLHHNIQEIIMHEELYSVKQLSFLQSGTENKKTSSYNKEEYCGVIFVDVKEGYSPYGPAIHCIM
jgi:hypothetical protein